MGTCRAIRYFTSEPVPDELIDTVIWAATRAPSPGNSQGWDFVVVTDPDKRQAIGDAVSAAMSGRIGAMTAADRSTRLMLAGAASLAAGLASAPVLILVCGPVIYPAASPRESFTWSAIYPAAANLIVGARALGLGTTFTTFHGAAEPAIRQICAIPAEIKIGALIPMGWPAREFGPVNRRPPAEFVHKNTWQGRLRD